MIFHKHALTGVFILWDFTSPTVRKHVAWPAGISKHPIVSECVPFDGLASRSGCPLPCDSRDTLQVRVGPVLDQQYGSWTL